MFRRRLEKKIKLLSSLVSDNSESVVKSFKSSVNLFLKKNVSSLPENKALSQPYEVSNKIEKLCIEIIALHKPTTSHLRMILMTFKINADLDRIFDLTEGINELYDSKSKKIIKSYLDSITKITDLTIDSLKNAIKAFTEQNTSLAEKVLDDDKKINETRTEIIKKILKRNKLSDEYNLIRVIQKIERIGDHCKNISRSTIYVTQGILNS